MLEYKGPGQRISLSFYLELKIKHGLEVRVSVYWTIPWANMLAARVDDLIPGTYVVEREPTPASCLLTSTCALGHLCTMCSHTIHKS